MTNNIGNNIQHLSRLIRLTGAKDTAITTARFTWNPIEGYCAYYSD